MNNPETIKLICNRETMAVIVNGETTGERIDKWT